VRDEHEAAIVVEAGAPGAVTISTNMAGRGTDIRLGGGDERDRDRVVASGGLYVIGTNRHESRRIDDQLRGRAARQGDPGRTCFFVSLEDPLIERYGVQRLIPKAHMPSPSTEPIDHPVIRREIARAQRIVEGENLDLRRTLSRYSEMLEQQRATLQRRREETFRLPEEDDRGPDATRLVALAEIDANWREHLAFAADLREGVHLLRVMRLDPLAEFQRKIIEAWSDRMAGLGVRIERRQQALQLDAEGRPVMPEQLLNPMSTWTYLINDEPFRNQLYEALGGTAMGLGIVFNFPIVLAWWLWRRHAGRRSRKP
jgi:preprotein translocase subunit SecA